MTKVSAWILLSIIAIAGLVYLGANECQMEPFFDSIGVAEAVDSDGNCRKLTLAEWGDFLGGILSVIALAWFVATLFVQRAELRSQLLEFRETRRANIRALLLAEVRASEPLLTEYCRLFCRKNAELSDGAGRIPENEVFRWLSETEKENIESFKQALESEAAYHEYLRHISDLIKRGNEVGLYLGSIGVHYKIYCRFLNIK